MRVRAAAASLAILAAALLDGRALAADAPPPSRCALNKVADLPAHIAGRKALLPGSVNGRPVKVLIDTGAASSLLMRGAARALGLPLAYVRGARAGGVGGVTQLQVAHVGEFSLAGVKVANMDLMVGGEAAVRSDFDMLLGQDFLGNFDVEFDLAHQAVRLFQPRNCGEQDMAYWAQTYDETPLLADRENWLGLRVKINGRAINAILDSGAATSVATLQVARVAGVKLDDTDLKYQGLGASQLSSKMGDADVTIGQETVRKARLRFADLFGATTFAETGSMLGHRLTDEPDMLLGFDFLRSHRVLISRSRNMIYFTYEGGPVFEPQARTSPAPRGPPGAGAAPGDAAGAPASPKPL